MLGITPTAAARKQLEDKMKSFTYRDEFVDGYIEQGIEKGVELGQVKDAVSKLLKLLDGRRLQPTQEQRKLVADCTDLRQLDLWFDRALTASSANDVFKP